MQFHFPGQTGFYKGKVRDVYYLENETIILIASDRISAFDRILPRPIPFKGQILNQIAAFMLELTSDACPNWLEATPAPNVSIGKLCSPYKIEMVVRGNLTGHAWRSYSGGSRNLCGVNLPDGLKENDFFPQPIITPATKAPEGHDLDISREEILRQQIISEKEYEQIEASALALFATGAAYASTRGLVLADAKYEFGNFHGKILLMDEVHTPDSARYFISSDLEASQEQQGRPRQLSKEFVREWLIAEGFMGEEGQPMPEMTEERVLSIQNRYIELYERLLGLKFKPEALSDEEAEERILHCLRS